MIRTCFECSTLHLPEYAVLRLEDSAGDALETGLGALYGLSVYEMPGRGFILPVPETKDELDDVTKLRPLADLLTMARRNGCSWLVLDAEGEILPDVQVYGRN